jgi:hypothetical protein
MAQERSSGSIEIQENKTQDRINQQINKAFVCAILNTVSVFRNALSKKLSIGNQKIFKKIMMLGA